MHLVHSGPVVTHRSASGAQPAGATGLRKRRRHQRICQNQDYQLEISHAVPLVNTNMGAGKLVLAPSRPDTAAEIVEHKINILDHCQAARSRGTDRT